MIQMLFKVFKFLFFSYFADFAESHLSVQRQSDENKEIKNDLRKHKEKLEKKQSDLETITLELKHR